MKKLLYLLLLSLPLAAQNTSISSSMVDTDGIAWANGTWRMDFRPNPSFPNESTYHLLNGQPLSAAVLHQNGVLDGSGAFSITIYDSTLIAPTGSGWTITLCSLTIAPCGTYQFSSAGTSMDISSRLTTSIAAPRFLPNNGAFGYADVEVQTSINQGSSYWNVTTQTQHIWNGQAWVIGGGGGGTAPPPSGVVTATALPGYKASPDAPSTNRDQKLAVTVTPQDFCPNAGSGNMSDNSCFWSAMRWLATANTNVPKRLVIPWTPQGYQLSSVGYCCLATLPYDFGDYHGSAGYNTLANVNVFFGSGLLTSCTITGGSGYAPNAKLPIQILDPQHLGSGAAAYVLTDSNGNPASSCVIQHQGINYPDTGVQAFIIPLGGDGAAGTVTLSGGTFSGGTVTAGGFGYSDGATGTQMSVAAMVTGLTCSTYPVFNVVVGTNGTPTGGQITGVTVSTAGTNCSIAGNNSPGTVSLIFGASCGGVQCHLMDPEPVIDIPIAIPIYAGVEIVGVGNPSINAPCAIANGCGISTSYAPPAPVCNSTPPLNCTIPEPAAFGDPWGDQMGAYRGDLLGPVGASNMNPNGKAATLPRISNLSVSAIFDFWIPALAGGTFSNIGLGGGVGFYIGTIQEQQGRNGGTAQLSSIFRDLNFSSLGGFLIAGDWFTRNPGYYYPTTGRYYGYAGGSRGGTIMGHYYQTSVAYTNGSIGYLSIENPQFNYYPTFDLNWDKWVEQYLWKSQNSPATPYSDAGHLMSNGAAPPCPDQDGVAKTGRATDDYFNMPGIPSLSQYPWWNCFRGIRGGFVMAQPRYSYNNSTINSNTYGNDSVSVRIINGRYNNLWRPIFEGAPLMTEIKNNVQYQASTGADAYMPTGTPTYIWLLMQGDNRGLPGGVVEDIVTGTSGRAFQVLYYGVPNTFSATGAGYPNNLNLARFALRNVSGFNDQVKSSIAAGVIYSGTQSVANASNVLAFPTTPGFAAGSVTLPAGTYRVAEYGWVTTAVAAGTMSMCLSWNDGSATTSAPCPISAQPAAALTNNNYFVRYIHSANSGYFSFTNSCVSSTCSFDYIVERLQ